MSLYGWIGLAALIISEAGMFAHVEPFWSWHTPIAWTGYILLIDALIYRKRGSSWLTTNRREFWFLAALSVPLWVVFEGYNLLIRNWHYINLPEHPVARYFGYAWSFATIWPAIFETAELVALFRGQTPALEHAQGNQRRVNPAVATALVALGLAMLTWPLIWPSPYLAAPVWLGFILLLDPLNDWRGAPSLVGDLDRKSTRLNSSH